MVEMRFTRTRLIDRLKRAALFAPGLPSVMASPPTVSTSAANTPTLAKSYPSISSGVLTPQFDYGAGNVAQGGASFPDTLTVTNKSVNYGATVGATVAGNFWTIDFMTDAPSFEVGMKGLGGSSYRILVDGQLVQSDVYPDKTANGSLYYDLFAFGSRKVRRITVLATGNLRFVGVNVDAQSRVWAVPVSADEITAIIEGDSISEGSSPAYPDGLWAAQLRYRLGWKALPAGVGSTGYRNNGSTKMTFRSRFAADVSAFSPDVIVFAGGINDSSSSQAQMTAECDLLFAQALSENPNAFVFVLGPWTSPASATPSAINAGIKASALASPEYGVRLFFIETMTDPADPWQYGTGKVGTTNGTGNSDFYISADGTHPPQAGHDYLASRFDTAVRTLLAAL